MLIDIKFIFLSAINTTKGNYLVPERKPANFFKFKTGDDFNRKCPAGNALGVNT